MDTHVDNRLKDPSGALLSEAASFAEWISVHPKYLNISVKLVCEVVMGLFYFRALKIS